MGKYRHLFFDLDGTLTDSEEGIVNSIRYALTQMGVETGGSDFRECLGPPLAQSFQAYFGRDEEKTDQAVRLYRQRFEERGMLAENRLYPGVRGMLDALRGRGYSLSVVTSKPEDYALKIISHFELDPFFSGVYGSTFTSERTQKIDVLNHAMREQNAGPEVVAMVGDRMYDLEAAAQAGADAVGVLYGYGGREELQAYRTVLLAERVEDLLAFFQ